MNRIRIVLYLSLAFSVLGLGLAYFLAGYWLILVALACMALFWYFFRKSASFGVVTALLLVQLFLCAFGLLRGLSFPLILLASISALVAWDLLLFSRDVHKSSLRDPSRMEGEHLMHLGLVAGLGLLLAGFASIIHFNIPFGLILGLALLAVGGIVWGLRRLRNRA